jgi:SAM-dependent methyltransferase
MNLSHGLQLLVPPALRPTAKAVYYKLFRFQLGVRFWLADRVGDPLPEVPVPPAILRYRVSELLPVSEFLRIGAGCASLIRQRVDDMGVDFATAQRVLDFGCGCGRTIRWFLRDCNAEFHGVDVDSDAVDWCARHLQRGYFLANALSPPLPYPSGYFDIVYCLSVFTHLNEPMQDIWLAELSRILRPGGVLLLTIYGEASRKGLDSEGQSVLQAKGFLHRRSQKLRGLVPDWYQTTWHTRKYIVNRLSAWFGDVRYFAVPDGAQDVVGARKASG